MAPTSPWRSWRSARSRCAGVGRGAGDDQLRLVLAARRFHRVVVDLFLGVQAVGDDVEPLAGHVQRHAVGQVAAFGQAHAHDGVAGLQKGQEHALVGLRAGVRLDVGGSAPNIFLRRSMASCSADVDVLAAAVVALAGIALGVLVGPGAMLAADLSPVTRTISVTRAPGSQSNTGPSRLLQERQAGARGRGMDGGLAGGGACVARLLMARETVKGQVRGAGCGVRGFRVTR